MMHLSSFFLSIFLISVPNVIFSKKNDILKSSTELLEKEAVRLEEETVRCGLSVNDLSERQLDHARDNYKNEKAIACHIKYLKESPGVGWVWSSLGHLYLQQSGTKYSSLGTSCFKQAAKLSGNLSKHVRHWFYLAPFVIGKIEVDGDPLSSLGGIYNISMRRHKRDFRAYSELVPHGEIQWRMISQSKPEEYIQIAPHITDNLQWNDLVSSLGSTGITEWQGWAVGSFAVNSKDLNVNIQCLGVHTVYVNQIPVTGEVYRRNQYWFSVSLPRGIHNIYIRLRAKATQVFNCQLRTSPADYEIIQPHYSPDFYDGYLFSHHLYLPVTNLHASKWLKNLRVTLKEQSLSSKPLTLHQPSKAAVAPGQTLPIVLELTSSTEGRILDACEDVTLKLQLSSSLGQQVFPLTLRCRKRRQSFLFTFLDHDGSVQHAAAVEPITACDPCPLVLSLHGTTVPAQNQADSHKRMVGGEYVFGVDGAWLLAPTRHGAHNWEGPGALTAMTAAQRLAELVEAQSWLTSKLAPDHIIFAGHSMGGHGAWHLASHYPDKALALVSLAGWNKKEEYGDSNLFFRHDISASHVDPRTKAILEACIAENEADRHVSNLKGLPVLARIGANDRTVHPYYVRRMYRLLRENHVDVSYVEIPEKEHWWWDTKSANDGGCVNDQQIRDFFQLHSNIPQSSCEGPDQCHSSTEAASKYSIVAQNFTLTVVNPALTESMHGLRVVRQIIPMATSHLQVNLYDGFSTISTLNVQSFAMRTSHLRPVHWCQHEIQVDDQTISSDDCDTLTLTEDACLCLKSSAWEVCFNCSLPSDHQRAPSTMGPARRVAEHPFLIVIGSNGDSLMMTHAVYLANLFYLTSDTHAVIVKDVDVTDDMKDDFNLIVLGSPQENSLTSALLDAVPLSYDAARGLRLGSCVFSTGHTGALFLAPSGSRAHRLALVLFGTDADGTRDIISLAAPTIPPMTRSPFSNLIPDFVVTGRNFQAHGPGGYECTGFWNDQWKLSPELVSCAHCLHR